MKSFTLWLEEKEHHYTRMLLRRLGFDPHETPDIKLRELNKDRLKDQLGNMGLDPDKVTQLQNWVDMNRDSTLQNLLDQIDDEEMPNDSEELPGQPAQLPQGQPKPQQRQPMMPPQMGGMA